MPQFGELLATFAVSDLVLCSNLRWLDDAETAEEATTPVNDTLSKYLRKFLRKSSIEDSNKDFVDRSNKDFVDRTQQQCKANFKAANSPCKILKWL
jgi:hypothetical protein